MAKTAVKEVAKEQVEVPPEIRFSAAPSRTSDYRFEQERLADKRLIKGTFQDNELKGGKISFPFKKYKGDDIVMYTLVDGQEYELPLGVVKHLNNNCAYTTHSFILDKNGQHMKNPLKTHRFSFKAAEFC